MQDVESAFARDAMTPKHASGPTATWWKVERGIESLVSVMGRWSWLPVALTPILVLAAGTSREELTAKDIVAVLA